MINIAILFLLLFLPLASSSLPFSTYLGVGQVSSLLSFPFHLGVLLFSAVGASVAALGVSLDLNSRFLPPASLSSYYLPPGPQALLTTLASSFLTSGSQIIPVSLSSDFLSPSFVSSGLLHQVLQASQPFLTFGLLPQGLRASQPSLSSDLLL